MLDRFVSWWLVEFPAHKSEVVSATVLAGEASLLFYLVVVDPMLRVRDDALALYPRDCVLDEHEAEVRILTAILTKYMR